MEALELKLSQVEAMKIKMAKVEEERMIISNEASCFSSEVYLRREKTAYLESIEVAARIESFLKENLWVKDKILVPELLKWLGWRLESFFIQRGCCRRSHLSF
ncbi:hypothetical protein HAX54_000515 [Datura stramonium]|uniref:Uncharacterized protein n=1 Tax=Datura stramonium TaxID=4076 RepID=A0ABS8WQ15_DATST|nr:hypothetical protein [Datura stramonium]